MNSSQDLINSGLVIEFNMRDDLFDLEADEMECVPHTEYKKKMNY